MFNGRALLRVQIGDEIFGLALLGRSDVGGGPAVRGGTTVVFGDRLVVVRWVLRRDVSVVRRGRAGDGCVREIQQAGLA